MPRDDLANETSKLSIARDDEERRDRSWLAAARIPHNVLNGRGSASPYHRPANLDVTQTFVTASAQLLPGDLIKDEYFTLFEAVGALEIMDSKMDSGYLPPDDSFEADFDVCSAIHATNVLWIMDELIRLEMNLHDGYPLSQNLFTSLHLFHLLAPDNSYPYQFRPGAGSDSHTHSKTEHQLVHLVLRAYCIGVIKCCHLTIKLVQAYTFFEEEDFVTYLFGRELLPKLEIGESAELLANASDWLSKSSVDPKMKSALESRLHFRQILLSSMTMAEGADEDWEGVKTHVLQFDESHQCAIPIHQAFSTKVQRQLASSTPPRPMPELSWQEACSRWAQMCDHVLAAHSLTSIPIRRNPHCLQRAAWTFAYRTPPPNTYARAKMQELLTRDDVVANDMPQFDLLMIDIRDSVLPGDPLADPANFQITDATDDRFRCARLIGEFMSRAFGEYTNIYRMLCQNRCRMRRTFTQGIPVWDGLETIARETDASLHSIMTPRRLRNESEKSTVLEPMTFWVRSYKLQMMEHVILLGFETDLYPADDLGTMYAVLSAIISKRSEIVSLSQAFAGERLLALQGTRDEGYFEECVTSLEWLRASHLSTTATLAIASALCTLYGALELAGIVDVTPKPYFERQLHYEARLKPLLNLEHDVLPDIEAIEAAKGRPNRPLNEAYGMVTGAVAHARAQLAALKLCTPTQIRCIGTEDHWRHELKQMDTVCVAITVAATQLNQMWRKHASTNGREKCDLKRVVEVTIAPPGERYHDWWVVPKLREIS